ncbi:MAG: hypothetical protein FJY81_03270 [Candidatus Aminicenantes bacterium]|nr:hypothetical protein [Candidatus Aminicenantes bacterium]
MPAGRTSTTALSIVAVSLQASEGSVAVSACKQEIAALPSVARNDNEKAFNALVLIWPGEKKVKKTLPRLAGRQERSREKYFLDNAHVRQYNRVRIICLQNKFKLNAQV